MLDEVRRLKQAQQKYLDDFKTEVSFEEFVKLFVNHFYRITDDEVEEAFKVLGFKEDCDEEPYICRHDFIKYMTEEGKKCYSNLQ
jgi:Ca2+-binding EF-hand superfamily protein